MKDQAESLRKAMVDKQEESVNSLPSRKEVHNKKKSEFKLKFRYPLVRLLAIIFLIIVIVVPGYFFKSNVGQNSLKVLGGSSKTNDSSIEEVEYGSNKEIENESENSTTVNPEGKIESVSPKENNIPQVEQTDNNEQVNQTNTETITKSANQKQTEEYIIHRVSGNETLFRISMKYYKNRNGEEIIKRINGLDSNGTVYPGQKLKIPKNR